MALVPAAPATAAVPLALPALHHGVVAGVDLLLQRSQLPPQRLQPPSKLARLACMW